jgi:hypothetical protein
MINQSVVVLHVAQVLLVDYTYPFILHEIVSPKPKEDFHALLV